MSNRRAARPILTILEGREVPAAVDLFAVGSGAGIEAQVKVLNADNSARFNLAPFPGFAGGAAVSTGDVTGDGVEDIAVGAGPGGGPHVKLFDGNTGAELRSFFAFDPAFSGGVFVGLGDVTGDGLADVVVGAGEGGGPHVKVFDGATGAEVRSFFAYDPAFRGGVAVRAGDVGGDGLADIVTGAGPGGGPHVQVFDAKTLNVIQSFFGGDPNNRDGVFVGVADFTGTGAFKVTASADGKIFAPGYIEQENAIRVPGAGLTGRVPVAAVRLSSGTIAVLIGTKPITTPGEPGITTMGEPGIIGGITTLSIVSTFRGGVFVG